MPQPNISKYLRFYRKKSNLKGPDVIKILDDKGIKISVKSLYNWETGRSQPDCDTFIKLCDIYGIKNIVPAFGFDLASNPNNFITYKSKLLEKINTLDDDCCKTVLAIIDELDC
ncbi:hypothetical protein SDC9_179507 [bioreactor metagenome]|uniref:HTH cro/C1-type domain-containing protein n=1 Tax=bioreactor metagenome TaxID=1076179 RepID=A0A645GZ05_9ZZZZ